jgi:hypothetical protein
MRGPAAALRRLETREALLLAFFATFIVLAKAALRWHLQVPGHVMFATALFLILARGAFRARARPPRSVSSPAWSARPWGWAREGR